MKEFDRERVREALKFDKDGLHQALLNIAYDGWQKNKDWTMEDMLQYALEFGSVVQLAVLLGKYNQQVTNGGHSQYFDNGYSGDHKYKSRNYYNYDVPRSVRMLELMQKFKLDTLPRGEKVAAYIGEFIDRTQSFESGNSYDSYYEDCEEDDSMPNYDDLDTAYYEINEDWMKDLEQYFKLWMEHNKDPIANNLIS